MTDGAWLKGLGELLACLPAQDETPERKATRGTVYRQELDGLSDDLWLAAVRIAVQRDKWFPPIATLLQYASEAASAPSSKGYLPESTLTPEERSAAIRRGVDVFRAELRRLGVPEPDALVTAMSREPGIEG